MGWNWEHPDWPAFLWAPAPLAAAEERFLLAGGTLIGSTRTLDEAERLWVVAESMSEEAMTTSEIEGEMLDRASVQSSIRRGLGLDDVAGHVSRPTPAERGIGELMLDLYRNHAAPLTHEMLFGWHGMVCAGRPDLRDLGRYRTGAEPMQVVSGAMHAPKVHFEAPPRERVPGEMERFIEWFNSTGPDSAAGDAALPAITRAGIAHLYFESIHPFEDGNGRIGRAISEKALAQALGRPSLTALAAQILATRRGYYEALEAANRKLRIDGWLTWFSRTVLAAQERTLNLVDFVIAKARLLDRCRGQLNPRQEKALLRMLREGPDGFKGGLSAANYVAITKTSPATATRDLADMVEKGVLTRTGEKRHARYWLRMPDTSQSRTTLQDRT